MYALHENHNYSDKDLTWWITKDREKAGVECDIPILPQAKKYWISIIIRFHLLAIRDTMNILNLFVI